jgi:hypothetical protein
LSKIHFLGPPICSALALNETEAQLCQVTEEIIPDGHEALSKTLE